MPAQVFGPMDQGALRELTVERLTHVLRARLANGDDRLAVEMSRGNFHLAQTEIGGHGSPSENYPATSRSEEHTSELSHGYISYAVFCLKKKKPDIPRTS